MKGWGGRIWHGVFALLAVAALTILGSVVADMAIRGASELSWRFVTSFPGNGTSGGVWPELVNTLTMVGMAAGITFPLGVAAAIWRVEYRELCRAPAVFDRLTQMYASVPGIVIGLVVYEGLVAAWGWPLSVAAGTVALGLLNWPFAVALARQGLEAVPDTMREASLALGATRAQTVWRAVLPLALPDLVAGFGLATARLMGESAALIVTAGVNVTRHWGLAAPGETLAVHLWYIRTEGVGARPGEASATGLVLLLLVVAVLWGSRRTAGWIRVRFAAKATPNGPPYRDRA